MAAVTALICGDPLPNRVAAAEALRRRLPPPRLDERADVRSAEYLALLATSPSSDTESTGLLDLP